MIFVYIFIRNFLIRHIRDYNLVTFVLLKGCLIIIYQQLDAHNHYDIIYSNFIYFYKSKTHTMIIFFNIYIYIILYIYIYIYIYIITYM